jgi:hypothetical protein
MVAEPDATTVRVLEAGHHAQDRRLADPDGPSRTTNWPAATSKLTSFTAVTDPNRLVR